MGRAPLTQNAETWRASHFTAFADSLARPAWHELVVTASPSHFNSVPPMTQALQTSQNFKLFHEGCLVKQRQSSDVNPSITYHLRCHQGKEDKMLTITAFTKNKYKILTFWEMVTVWHKFITREHRVIRSLEEGWLWWRALNPSTQETKAEDFDEVPGQPGLHRAFQARTTKRKPISKKKKYCDRLTKY